MAIVAGFDVHRNQITFDALDGRSGELTRGRIPSHPRGGAGLGRALPRPAGAGRAQERIRVALALIERSGGSSLPWNGS
jgi:hypothetical protein